MKMELSRGILPVFWLCIFNSAQIDSQYTYMEYPEGEDREFIIDATMADEATEQDYEEVPLNLDLLDSMSTEEIENYLASHGYRYLRNPKYDSGFDPSEDVPEYFIVPADDERSIRELGYDVTIPTPKVAKKPVSDGPKVNFKVIRSMPDSDCPKQVGLNDTVTFHYEIRLKDEEGDVMDSSRMENRNPIVGDMDNAFLKGWQEGMLGMCPGEIRQIYVPSDMAFKSLGLQALYGYIPPNSDLFVEVEVLKIEVNKPLTDEEVRDKHLMHFELLDLDQDERLSPDEYISGFIGDDAQGDDKEQVEHIVKSIFETEDENGDGFISKAEYIRVKTKHLKPQSHAEDDSDDGSDARRKEEL